MLPDIKYAENAGARQLDGWNGINLSDSATDGELTGCFNMSSRRYPFLTPKLGRTEMEGYSSAEAVFAWDKLCVADGGILYYDGEKLSDISDRPQFAVINTKLCIFPDKKYIDLVNNEFKSLETAVTMSAAPVFEDDRIICTTAPLETTVNTPYSSGTHYTYTYGTDPEALDWNENDGWTLPQPSLWRYNNDTGSAYRGRIVIPKIENGVYSFASFYPSSEASHADENNEGVYGITQRSTTASSGRTRWQLDIYRKGVGNPLLTAYFSEGDRVTVSGCNFSVNNVEFAKVETIDDGENALIFPANTFVIPNRYKKLTDTANAGNYQFKSSDTSYYKFKLQKAAAAGDIFYQKSKEIYLWRESDKSTEKMELTSDSPDSSSTSGYTTIIPEAFTGEESMEVKVSRTVPDMDFICECGNRLWGVSNNVENRIWNAGKQKYETVNSRVIYASALGDPTNFYVYDGLSTDSYAVSVASRSNFTACMAYSGSVLCWKEDMLHRVAGDYPSNYRMYTYNIEGVQQGGSKSGVIINEILYYKGRDGIYAYAGGQPSLISYNLGPERYSNALACSDGVLYLVSMEDEKGDRHLFEYDTVHGIWYRQDNIAAKDFAYLDGYVYCADGNRLWKLDSADSSDVEWSAELREFDENTFLYKQYRWLRLEAELSAGARLEAYITIDGEGPERVLSVSRAGRQYMTIPLRGMRCRRLGLTLSGRGNCVIRRLQRDYIICSEER